MQIGETRRLRKIYFENEQPSECTCGWIDGDDVVDFTLDGRCPYHRPHPIDPPDVPVLGKQYA